MIVSQQMFNRKKRRLSICCALPPEQAQQILANKVPTAASCCAHCKLIGHPLRMGDDRHHMDVHGSRISMQADRVLMKMQERLQFSIETTRFFSLGTTAAADVGHRYTGGAFGIRTPQ